MLNKSIKFISFALATGALSGTASAQDILESCESDIAAYCSAVTLEDGRLGSCLYAHTDSLTDDCYAATEGTSTILETFFDRLTSVHEVCAVDIQEHCAGIIEGGGRIMVCLSAKNEEIDPACNQGISLLSAALAPEVVPE
ncbi:MAG: cysteine rich repeat-containing protein [Pseudomonadota bacterium]